MNTYGRDVTVPGSSNRPLFAELLRQVGAVDGIRRVRFTSPHPHDFTPDVIDAMAETPAVCEHIHFPLQSGSDRVLKAMRRSYRRDRYLGWLDAIRDAIPDIAVSTDVIVGFPGETEEDFAQTLDVVERARFDSAYTFQYSPRPGTRAAAYDDQIPKEVVQERFDRLVELQQRISLERSLAQVGATFEVLVEGAGKRGPSTQARTRTNRIVHIPDALEPGIVRARQDRGGVGAPSDGSAGAVAGGRGRLRAAGMSRRPPLALVGPTAVGKTDLSLALAESLGAEIVSVDSMLVYRGMDVGTAKPSPAERARVPHHLIDVAEPSEPFSVARFQEEAREAVARDRRARPPGAARRRIRPLLPRGRGRPGVPGNRPRDAIRAGATGGRAGARADVRALGGVGPGRGRADRSGQRATNGAGPRGAGDHRAAVLDVRRGVGTLRRPMRFARPDSGCRARRCWHGSASACARCSSEGWLDEVRSLVERGFGGWLTSTQAIGYAELARHLRGDMTMDAAVEATVKRTGNLARRQMAWFRRDPRIRWFDVDERGAMTAVEPILAYLTRPWEDE